MAESKSQPVPDQHLKQIIQDACDTTLSNAETYVHSLTEEWNNTIITKILQSLVSNTSNGTKQYKYAVNSTIIQHLAPTTTSTSTGAGTAGTQTQSPPSTPPQTTDTSAAETGASSTAVEDSATAVGASSTAQEPEHGRRGMRSTLGCYWNEGTDGKFSFSWKGGKKGMDVVVSVLWISV